MSDVSETEEQRNPFSMEEHALLGRARESGDLEYLMSWSKAAFKYYESEKGRLMKLLEEQYGKLKTIKAIVG